MAVVTHGTRSARHADHRDDFETPLHAHIRTLATYRLERMNGAHALQAWERRRIEPIGPIGLAFFYGRPTGRPLTIHEAQYAADEWEVGAATRLIPDAEAESNNLPRLLYRLCELAQERYMPGFDPRRQMCDRADDVAAGRDAQYVGVGVSRIDRDALYHSNSTSSLDVGGQCLLLTRDGTMIVIDRAPKSKLSAVTIRSTRSLLRQCRRVDPGSLVAPDDESDEAQAWRQLDHLHRLVLSALAHTPTRRQSHE